MTALSTEQPYDYDDSSGRFCIFRGAARLSSVTAGRDRFHHSLFQGLWNDPVTGIAYARNRWYDARTASWLSEDPLGAVDSPDLYAFVGWGPHRATDPLGAAHLDPNSTEDEIRWIGDRSDEVVVTAEDPEMTRSEKYRAALRVAGADATTEEVPWDPVARSVIHVAQTGSIEVNASVPILGLAEGSPIEFVLDMNLDVTLEGMQRSVGISPGTGASFSIMAVYPVSIGEAPPENERLFDVGGSIRGGDALGAGLQVETDMKSVASGQFYADVEVKAGFAWGPSGRGFIGETGWGETLLETPRGWPW